MIKQIIKFIVKSTLQLNVLLSGFLFIYLSIQLLNIILPFGVFLFQLSIVLFLIVSCQLLFVFINQYSILFYTYIFDTKSKKIKNIKLDDIRLDDISKYILTFIIFIIIFFNVLFIYIGFTQILILPLYLMMGYFSSYIIDVVVLIYAYLYIGV